MDKMFNMQHSKTWLDWQSNVNEHVVDSMQRSIIFTDILRKRGNNLYQSYKKRKAAGAHV